MAKTVKALNLRVVHPLPGVPFGNVTVLPFSMTFLEGVAVGTDTATAVVHTDTLVFGKIPKDFKVLQAFIRSTAALGASGSTLDIGFAYVDGVDVTAFPANIDEWADAQANVAVFSAIGNTAPVPKTFSKDAYLTATINTAALLTTGSLTGSIIIQLLGYFE